MNGEGSKRWPIHSRTLSYRYSAHWLVTSFCINHRPPQKRFLWPKLRAVQIYGYNYCSLSEWNQNYPKNRIQQHWEKRVVLRAPFPLEWKFVSQAGNEQRVFKHRIKYRTRHFRKILPCLGVLWDCGIWGCVLCVLLCCVVLFSSLYVILFSPGSTQKYVQISLWYLNLALGLPGRLVKYSLPRILDTML